MSGGSYNYLCYNTDELTSHRGSLKAMAERLAALGWAPEAAEATQRLIDDLDRVAAAAEALKDVWHAVEWWDSCDYGEDQVREEIDRYRASLPEQPAVHGAYTVRLETAASGDLAARTLTALRMIRGVVSVEPQEQR